jgi:hypothetical protein
MPMAAEAVATLVGEYLRADHAAFRTVYPLLDPAIEWRHLGEHPLAGVYADRDAVIGLFSAWSNWPAIACGSRWPARRASTARRWKSTSRRRTGSTVSRWMAVARRR